MRKQINELLLELGIPASLDGFNFIARAIELSIKQKMAMCKGIYTLIAEENGTKAQRVERSIRHAITKIDKDVYTQYGGRYYKNSDVIYTLALHFKEEQ
jgi:hypothetical protein